MSWEAGINHLSLFSGIRGATRASDTRTVNHPSLWSRVSHRHFQLPGGSPMGFKEVCPCWDLCLLC